MEKQIKRGLLIALSAGIIFTIPQRTTNTVAAEVVEQEAVIEDEPILPIAGIEKALNPNEEILELQKQIYELEREKLNLISQNKILKEENEELKKF